MTACAGLRLGVKRGSCPTLYPVVCSPQAWAIGVLDLDGTLLDIQMTPNDVYAPEGLVPTLADLVGSFDRAVAIITGRRVADADTLLAPLQLIHTGRAWRRNATIAEGDRYGYGAAVSERFLRDVLSFVRPLNGNNVEEKGAAIAVHYRKAPSQRALIERKLSDALRGRGHNLELSHGRMVLEIKSMTCSKGEALAYLARQPDFIGRRPIMIGDDAPDVDALAMAQRLGGLGLTVAGEYFTRSSSDFAGPAEVREWLKGLATSHGRRLR